MPKYRVTETITLYGGELILTDAQASARKHCLEPVEKKRGATPFWSPSSSKSGR